MRSRLRAVDGLLDERLGLVDFRFRLSSVDRDIVWTVAGVRVFGLLPLPVDVVLAGACARESADGRALSLRSGCGAAVGRTAGALSRLAGGHMSDRRAATRHGRGHRLRWCLRAVQRLGAFPVASRSHRQPLPFRGDAGRSPVVRCSRAMASIRTIRCRSCWSNTIIATRIAPRAPRVSTDTTAIRRVLAGLGGFLARRAPRCACCRPSCAIRCIAGSRAIAIAWFGRHDVCMMPTVEERARFL